MPGRSAKRKVPATRTPTKRGKAEKVTPPKKRSKKKAATTKKNTSSKKKGKKSPSKQTVDPRYDKYDPKEFDRKGVDRKVQLVNKYCLKSETGATIQHVFNATQLREHTKLPTLSAKAMAKLPNLFKNMGIVRLDESSEEFRKSVQKGWQPQHSAILVPTLEDNSAFNVSHTPRRLGAHMYTCTHTPQDMDRDQILDYLQDTSNYDDLMWTVIDGAHRRKVILTTEDCDVKFQFLVFSPLCPKQVWPSVALDSNKVSHPSL